ncbi:MAG: hypothetical protein MPJ08_07980 [Nitrosopumilus sp.]|nr:hypothetical protein [Nitrosopumilus sp.]
MGITTKVVNGRTYLYHWHNEGGKKHETYCGLEGDPESERTALSMELEVLESRRDEVADEIRRVRARLKRLPR